MKPVGGLPNLAALRLDGCAAAPRPIDAPLLHTPELAPQLYKDGRLQEPDDRESGLSALLRTLQLECHQRAPQVIQLVCGKKKNPMSSPQRGSAYEALIQDKLWTDISQLPNIEMNVPSGQKKNESSDAPDGTTMRYCIGTVHRFHDKGVSPAGMVDGWRHVSPKVGLCVLWDRKWDDDDGLGSIDLAEKLKGMVEERSGENKGFCLTKPQGSTDQGWETTLRDHVRAVELVTLEAVESNEPLVMMTGNWQLASDFDLLRDALYEKDSDYLLSRRIAPAIAMFEHRHMVSVLRGEFHVRERSVGLAGTKSQENAETHDAMAVMARLDLPLHNKPMDTMNGDERALVRRVLDTEGFVPREQPCDNTDHIVAGDLDPAYRFRLFVDVPRLLKETTSKVGATNTVTVNESAKDVQTDVRAHVAPIADVGFIPDESPVTESLQDPVYTNSDFNVAEIVDGLVPAVVFDSQFDSLFQRGFAAPSSVGWADVATVYKSSSPPISPGHGEEDNEGGGRGQGRGRGRGRGRGGGGNDGEEPIKLPPSPAGGEATARGYRPVSFLRAPKTVESFKPYAIMRRANASLLKDVTLLKPGDLANKDMTTHQADLAKMGQTRVMRITGKFTARENGQFFLFGTPRAPPSQPAAVHPRSLANLQQHVEVATADVGKQSNPQTPGIISVQDYVKVGYDTLVQMCKKTAFKPSDMGVYRHYGTSIWAVPYDGFTAKSKPLTFKYVFPNKNVRSLAQLGLPSFGDGTILNSFVPTFLVVGETGNKVGVPRPPGKSDLAPTRSDRHWNASPIHISLDDLIDRIDEAIQLPASFTRKQYGPVIKYDGQDCTSYVVRMMDTGSAEKRFHLMDAMKFDRANSKWTWRTKVGTAWTPSTRTKLGEATTEVPEAHQRIIQKIVNAENIGNSRFTLETVERTIDDKIEWLRDLQLLRKMVGCITGYDYLGELYDAVTGYIGSGAHDQEVLRKIKKQAADARNLWSGEGQQRPYVAPYAVDAERPRVGPDVTRLNFYSECNIRFIQRMQSVHEQAVNVMQYVFDNGDGQGVPTALTAPQGGDGGGTSAGDAAAATPDDAMQVDTLLVDPFIVQLANELQPEEEEATRRVRQRTQGFPSVDVQAWDAGNNALRSEAGTNEGYYPANQTPAVVLAGRREVQYMELLASDPACQQAAEAARIAEAARAGGAGTSSSTSIPQPGAPLSFANDGISLTHAHNKVYREDGDEDDLGDFSPEELYNMYFLDRL